MDSSPGWGTNTPRAMWPKKRKKEKKKKRPKLEAEKALIDSLEVLSKQNPCQRNELIGENPCACDSERALVDCRNGFL